jgi:hypothetical protein
LSPVAPLDTRAKRVIARKERERFTLEPEESKMQDLDIDRVKDRMMKNRYSGVTDQLYSFGQFLSAELQRQTDRLDMKLLLVLGWNAAILAFLLIGLEQQVHATRGTIAPASWLMIGAVLCSLSSICLSFWGVRGKSFLWPSDRDWFKEELYDRDPVILKKYHIGCLLSAHRHYERANERKAAMLRPAQYLLAISATIIAAVLLLRLLWRLLLVENLFGLLFR